MQLALVARFIYFRVCKLTVKDEFIANAKQGKILARKCKNCNDLNLVTVYYCENCGKREFENTILDGNGVIMTYTIMTVPPSGFETFSPYAWAVMKIEGHNLNISGFLANIGKPADLPIGTAVKIIDFDKRGLVLEKR